MSEPDETLDPAVAALVQAERGREGAPASVRDAVRARVRSTIATGGGPPSTPSNPTAPPASNPSTPSAPSTGTALRRLAGWAGLLATGAAAGAFAHARLAAPRERIVYVDRVVEREVRVAVPAAPVTPSEPAALPMAAGADAAAASDAAASAAHTGTSLHRDETPDEHGSGDLDAERTLLDRARSALVRGRANDALAAIGERAQRFPRGQLAEEFEGLRVQALVAAHRYDEARAAATRFHERFGDSLLGPVVDAAIRTIP